jgi:hypothetical protein
MYPFGRSETGIVIVAMFEIDNMCPDGSASSITSTRTSGSDSFLDRKYSDPTSHISHAAISMAAIAAGMSRY